MAHEGHWVNSNLAIVETHFSLSKYIESLELNGDCRLQRFFAKKPRVKPTDDSKKTDEQSTDTESQDMFVERIRLENMELRFEDFLL